MALKAYRGLLMFSLLVAGILFGLVHPGAKWITSSGLGLIPFCVLFVGVRILIQFPIVFKTGEYRLQTREQWRSLLVLGLVGASLRITEFIGIVEGLPVSVVTFLIYLYPVWTIFFGRWLNRELITRLKSLKVLLALTAVGLISGVHLSHLREMALLWGPLAAGMLLSLWICLSNSAQKKGCSILSISFYYDLFSFLPLLSFWLLSVDSSESAAALTWLKHPLHWAVLFGYTLFTGLLPNYLFYFGVGQTTSVTAALFLLFEPIVATMVSVMVWNDPLSPYFYWGAAIILLLNLPDQLFRRWKTKAVHWARMPYQDKYPAVRS